MWIVMLRLISIFNLVKQVKKKFFSLLFQNTKIFFSIKTETNKNEWNKLFQLLLNNNNTFVWFRLAYNYRNERKNKK